MKILLAGLAATAALLLAPVAQAGCMATVGLSSLPKPGLRAGTPWVVSITVLQHGRTPLAGARPQVRIRSASGKLVTYRARATEKRGVYRARVVFPTAGRWRLAGYDGFVPTQCARVHTYAPVVVSPGLPG